MGDGKWGGSEKCEQRVGKSPEKCDVECLNEAVGAVSAERWDERRRGRPENGKRLNLYVL